MSIKHVRQQSQTRVALSVVAELRILQHLGAFDTE